MKFTIPTLALAAAVLAGCGVPCFTEFSGDDADIVSCPGPEYYDGPVAKDPIGPAPTGINWEEFSGPEVTCPPMSEPSIPIVFDLDELEDWGGPICGTPIVSEFKDIDWSKLIEPVALNDDVIWIPSIWPLDDDRGRSAEVLTDASLAELLDAIRRANPTPDAGPR